MGGLPKSLLRRDGEPLLLRQIRLLLQAGAGAIAVVLGHHVDQLEPVLLKARDERAHPGATVSWVVNPSPDDGPGSSLRCGLAALPQDLSAVLVALGDQPLLEAGDTEAVLRAWRTRGTGIELAVPCHAGQPGHPIAFGEAVRAAVMAGQGAAGVREWRRQHPTSTLVLELDHARCTTDVDTPADLTRLAAEWKVALTPPPSWTGRVGRHAQGD